MSAGHPEEHHRQISGGWIRAAIFGVSDGLVTNISFLLGFAGADPGHNVVRLAGLATLVAGGFSMGTGEYLSMRAQKELFEYEIGVERRALAESPEAERLELRDLFVSRAVSYTHLDVYKRQVAILGDGVARHVELSAGVAVEGQ